MYDGDTIMLVNEYAMERHSTEKKKKIRNVVLIDDTVGEVYRGVQGTEPLLESERRH